MQVTSTFVVPAEAFWRRSAVTRTAGFRGAFQKLQNWTKVAAYPVRVTRNKKLAVFLFGTTVWAEPNSSTGKPIPLADCIYKYYVCHLLARAL